MLDKMNVAEVAEMDAIRLLQDVDNYIEKHGGVFCYTTLPLLDAVNNLYLARDRLTKLLARIEGEIAA